MKLKKVLAVLLAAAMTFGLAACGGQSSAPAQTEAPAVESEAPATEAPAEESAAAESTEAAPEASDIVYAEQKPLVGAEYGTDYTSLYDQFGKDVSIADVIEDEETGLAYIDRDGVRYELGLDFLTMAMVYNTAVPEDGYWETEDDVYATWWKLYIQRWNILLPEIPLYSNEYYDVYNAQIKGVEEHPTNPYWGPASALIDWTSDKEDNSIILGNTTALSGRLRAPSFGVSSPGAGDLDVENLITGLETVSTTKEGGYEYNDTVVASHDDVVNDDGTRTFTVTLKDDLVFSDGSPVTAKNYLVYTLLNAGPVGMQAGGTGNSGLTYVGYDAFHAYDGTNDGADVDGVTASKVFSGIRLIDDYTFSVTVGEDYANYFYAITYAGFSPQPMALWVGDADIKDDGQGVYFTDDFYAKDGDSYVAAEQITNAVWDHTQDYPYSGPYMIESWDEADHSVVLTVNENFKGNYEGTKPQIEKVVYKRIISETQLADFTSGGVDVLSGITGGDATDEVIALVEDQPDKYVATHYSRAGYGKLGFRADLGPTQFASVREAIAYCMDRATFAKDFTGGYGGVTDGPYYTGSWMYQAAVADGMLLNAYDTSVDKAIEVLEADGWVYDAEGNPYESGVRYKQIPADQMYDSDKTYASVDGAYKVTQVGDNYYMPLVLNWYGTSDNEFTDLLVTGFMNNDNIKAAGFEVQQTVGDFNPMLDELTQGGYGVSYSGTPTYNCFNFATGFTSAAYDYSWNMTIDPSMYDDYSSYYIKDAADVYWLN